MRFFLCLILAFNAFRCGVEAGNAGGVKSKTGNVKILFAQQQNSGDESLSVQIGSLGLLDSSDSEVATLNPSISTVDLYGSTTSDNQLIAESTSIPTGSYAKIKIRLAGDKPIRYRDSGGSDHDVDVVDEAKDSFYFAQSITVTENATTTIVVNLDPYQSIQRSADDDSRYVFKPRGDATPHDHEVSYKGETDIASAQWVCAYAYAVLANFEDHEVRLDGGPGGDERPPGGAKIDGRPIFGTKSDLVKDTSSSCENSFAKTPIVNGEYEFRHLLLGGSYALRIFTSTGSYSDVVDDIVLQENRMP